MIDITQIVVALIGLLSTIITAFLIPFLKTKLNENQQKTLQMIVRTAVYAAEQIFGKDGIGEEKKEYVKNILSENGYEFDSYTINAEIESAVKELKLHLE